MHPHLRISASSAQLATEKARRRYERVTADMRHAVRLSFVLAIIAAGLLASGRTSLAIVGAVAAGLGVIIALSWRRAQKRERALWWQQARAGLVDALQKQRREQSEEPVAEEDDAVIIDLRDHRPHHQSATQNNDDVNVGDDSPSPQKH